MNDILWKVTAGGAGMEKRQVNEDMEFIKILSDINSDNGDGDQVIFGNSTDLEMMHNAGTLENAVETSEEQKRAESTL